LRSLAGSGAGKLALWAAALGFLALGVWQLASAVAVRTRGKSSRWVEKAKGIAKAVVYLALAWASFSFAKGQPSSSKAQSTGFTDSMLQQSHGRLLVALVGLVIIGIGAYHVVKGWKKKFLKDLTRNPGVQATRAGVVGYLAKGIALALVGLLFVTAAAQNSSSGATGLDGALRSLLRDSVGPWLLTAVGLGIGAYGVYSFARSKHARF
jgi:hypothetical protein